MKVPGMTEYHPALRPSSCVSKLIKKDNKGGDFSPQIQNGTIKSDLNTHIFKCLFYTENSFNSFLVIAKLRVSGWH